jgi:hypothetical protein
MSIIWTVLRQAVSSNIIVFSTEKAELGFNIVLSGTYIVIASAVLYKVLRDTKYLIRSSESILKTACAVMVLLAVDLTFKSILKICMR